MEVKAKLCPHYREQVSSPKYNEPEISFLGKTHLLMLANMLAMRKERMVASNYTGRVQARPVCEQSVN